jgi:hypothetical protein
MKTRSRHFVLTFLLFLSVAGNNLQAQNTSVFAERAQFSLGTFLEFIPMKYPITNANVFDGIPPFYNSFGVNANWVLLHSNDQLSLSASPGTHFAFSLNSRYGASLMFQAPVYLLGRIGANCTPFNESMFGFGAGIGANFSYVQFPVTNGFERIGRVSQPFIAPAAMVEFTGQFGKQAYSVRFHMNLMRFRGKVEVDPFISRDPIAVDYSNWGLGLMYYFY